MERESNEQKERLYPWQVVIYHEGRYLCWSTADKKPLYYNKDPKDFWKTLWAQWGPYSSIHANAVMMVAKEYGSMLGPTISPEEIVRGNKLGENEQELSLEQILEKYVQEGLSDDLPVEFGTLELTPGIVTRTNTWRDQRINEEIERHKKAMEELGFKFVV